MDVNNSLDGQRMRTSKLLGTPQALASEFARCRRDYTSLHIAVAWCGDPQQVLPYKHLEDFKGTIVSTVGISFNHTHPDAIEWLLRMGTSTRIFRRDCNLFHPKVYLFADGDRYALFAGSSNLTYGGFYTNLEVNVLIEGIFSAQDAEDIRGLRKILERWRSDDLSFKPDDDWLKSYRKDYKRDILRQRKYGINTVALHEEERIGRASWLQTADWKLYYEKVLEGLERYNRDLQSFHDVLDAAAQRLTLPWKRSYFRNPEARQIIGGSGKYGPLGHVAASGKFGHLLKSGEERWDTIVTAVSHIANLNPPLKWKELESRLCKLVELGNTMKVWGRVLCLVRPDLYCSVSSESFRRELAKTLLVPKTLFEDPKGYIQLIKLLHSSPWFNSPRPQDQGEAAVWARRVAFMDGVFWAPKDAQRGSLKKRPRLRA